MTHITVTAANRFNGMKKQCENALVKAGEARKKASEEGRREDERELIDLQNRLTVEMLQIGAAHRAYRNSSLPVDEAERRLGLAAAEARGHVERMARKTEALNRLRDLIGLLSRFALIFKP